MKNVGSNLSALVAGIVFALGLGISGMTHPAKVIAFLNFFGNWDPSLAFVMGGAMSVFAIAYRASRAMATPLIASAFSIPTRSDIDPKLVAGAALFGVGWGLGGFCPGPAIVSLASLSPTIGVFVLSMAAGMYGFSLMSKRSTSRIDKAYTQPQAVADA